MTITELWRFPVKSMQGARHDRLEVGRAGVVGDRRLALRDRATGKVLTAKRHRALLEASATDRPGGGVVVTLPDGTALEVPGAAADAVLSAWLGRDVHVAEPEPGARHTYEMTFDPPNDDAELVDIPTPRGSFVDLAPVHLLSTATLDACARARPDLDWDVRRFRPNVVVDVDVEPFGEDAWCGTEVALGATVVRPAQPTVRCAVPLRAQPGLERQAGLFAALDELHGNHLGVYCDVVRPGAVAVGDAVVVGDDR